MSKELEMIQNLNELMAVLMALAILILAVLLLPAFFELKKPKDGGPRRIPEIAPLKDNKLIQLVDVDDEQKFGILLLHKIAVVLTILPNLEV